MAKFLRHFLRASLFLAVLLTQTASALQCYHCKDCRNEVARYSTCRPGFDICMKREFRNKIEKACAPRVVCTPEEIDRKSPSLIQRLKTLFSARDINRLIRGSTQARSKTHYCCEEDFCNGSSSRRASWSLLLVLPLVIYLLGC